MRRQRRDTDTRYPQTPWANAPALARAPGVFAVGRTLGMCILSGRLKQGKGDTMETDEEINRIWKNTETPALDKMCDRLLEIHGELLGEDEVGDGEFADLITALSEQAFAAGFQAARERVRP